MIACEQFHNDLNDLERSINEFYVDFKVLEAKNKEVIKRLREEQEEIKLNLSNTNKQVSKIQEALNLKQTFLDIISNHWWKIVALMVPVLIAVGELMFYIKTVE